VDVAKSFRAKFLSKAFLKEYPPNAKYKDDIWDAGIVLDYYRNYTEFYDNLSVDEKALSLHSFYLVKTAVLIAFFGLLRPMELIQLRIDKDYMKRESDGGSFKYKAKSQLNRDTFFFIPSMSDKRICPWEAVNKLIELNKIVFRILTNSSTPSPLTNATNSIFLFICQNTGDKLESRFLSIQIKKELTKMGINTKDYSVYSIKHAAVSYLVKKKFTIKEIEQAMHYKQKKSTVTNHYAVKASIKKVGVMLASAVHEPDDPEQEFSESIVKADPEVKKAEQKVELIKILNTGIWDCTNEKEKELLIQKRAEAINELKDIVKGKANIIRNLYYSSSTTLPLTPEFQAFKFVENIYKGQLFYVNYDLFKLEFPNEPPPIKMLKLNNSLP
jgi:hypothetical protein